MCGICGMVGGDKAGFFFDHKESFKQMLLITSMRGSHSTGAFGVSKYNSNTPDIVKTVGSPYNLFEYSKSDEFFTRMVNNHAFVVGHGRYATMGGIDAETAHPFREGHITLVHNGVIRNYHQLKDFDKHKGIEVDSQLIARLFSEEGALQVLPRISGAYVFVWWDEREETLNFVKNDERPLFWGFYKDKELMTFASEYATIMWDSVRNGNPLKANPVTLTNHTIYSFKKGSLKWTTKSYKPRLTYVNNPNWPPRQDLDDDDWQAGLDRAAELRRKQSQRDEKLIGSNVSNLSDQRQKQFKSRRVKQAADISTEEDKLALMATNKTHGIRVGDTVEFQVEDYALKEGHGYILMWGDSDLHPNVEFYATSTDATQAGEQEVMLCKGVKGRVNSIQLVPHDSTFNGTMYRVFVTTFTYQHDNKRKKEKEIESDVPFVLESIDSVALTDSWNVEKVFTNKQVLDMIDLGCAWCQGKMKPSDLASPHLKYYEHADNKYSLLCLETCSSVDCSDTTRPH